MIRPHSFFLAVCFSVLFSGCASIITKRDVASQMEVPATQMFWIAHPCAQYKGIPFRKDQAFALDEPTGKIYSRTSESGEAKEVSAQPASGKGWQSVAEFFDAQGITQACAAADGNPNAVTSPVPAPSQPTQQKSSNRKDRDAEPPAGVVFQAPVNGDVHLYYQPLFADHSPRPLKAKMTDFLEKAHIQKVQAEDQVVDSCPATLEEGQVCVKPRVWSYHDARVAMYGDLDLRKIGESKYEVFDYYCQKWMGEEDFRGLTSSPEEMPGPGHILTAKKMNAEHSWPQSKFTEPVGDLGNLIEKTDLHHIFSTDSKVNNARANNEFAEVDPSTAQNMSCSDARSGKAIPVEGGVNDGTPVSFEPPRAMKGVVARALFYFSARFNAGMSKIQESYLRKWNRENPPDAQERERNEKVYQLIGTRNPFVDSPALADRVERFCREKLDPAQAPTSFDCISP